MDKSTPIEILSAGVEVLRPVLEPHGFTFSAGPEGPSSGGVFASGRFARGDRVIEFHYRHALGMVSYRIGDSLIDHENYLRFSGQWSFHKYPNYGGSPDESFKALASDLRAYFSDFLSGPGEYFRAVVAAYAADPQKFKGFSSLR